MGEDPRLLKMPAKPTLIDFFRLRFGPSKQHLLQSARLARRNGLPKKMVLACLLHDISVIASIRSAASVKKKRTAHSRKRDD